LRRLTATGRCNGCKRDPKFIQVRREREREIQTETEMAK
jgi:hypothetical protein